MRGESLSDNTVTGVDKQFIQDVSFCRSFSTGIKLRYCSITFPSLTLVIFPLKSVLLSHYASITNICT